ncbi:hypothetical protein CENSYa_0635 [Cenarchaeum symbiosum A]|uniref:Uncharacterized protein n=1 Tax=Cenarchaeum symbiosum (strain A) TaxID=414004 RepID=A0RVA1_CENSY|nr:hypothetical protein CENSYa_0635 [Cenarchaeum symbiosum A]
MTAQMGPDELGRANEIVELVLKINRKYPHVFLPGLLEDYIDGIKTSVIRRKYNIRNYEDFSYLASKLKFVGHRSTGKGTESRNANLSNDKWEQRYMLIHAQCDRFHRQISGLLNYNILRSFLVHAILEAQFIEYKEAENAVRETYARLKSIPLLEDDSIRESFEEYIQKDLRTKLNDITGELVKECNVARTGADISVPEEYPNITQTLHGLIGQEKSGITYRRLLTSIWAKFPLLAMVFGLDILNSALDDLEAKDGIVRKRPFSGGSPTSDQLFTHDNYIRMMEKVRTEKVLSGKTAFFGRNITPDQFIMELESLERGDLDDLDDQITRIAGLVLADSASLQSPKEYARGFDFVVDLTEYTFRPEHLDMMKNLDFEATAKIFHCKVMIDEEVTEDVISDLKRAVPAEEQGVVFTCRTVSREIAELTRQDRIIQVIGEAGIRNWCEITPIIPCRRLSVARIMYGDSSGSTVLVKSLNYESGLAVVEMPDGKEAAFPIGCMKEVDLRLPDGEDYEAANAIYFGLVRTLYSMSEDDFEDGMRTEPVAIHDTFENLQRKIHPELYEGVHPPINTEKKPSGISYVQFENVYASLGPGMGGPPECTCGKSMNETYYHTLCSHLVSGVIHYCLDGLGWDVIFKRIESTTIQLAGLRSLNMKRSIQAVYDTLGIEDREILLEYLQLRAEA